MSIVMKERSSMSILLFMLSPSDPPLISAIDVVGLEVVAGGTVFAAGLDSQNAFTTLIKGDGWMIFRNTLTGILHWDFVSLFLLSIVK